MRTPDEITNTENTIDSRDVIARIEYLESIIEDAEQEFEDQEPDTYADLAAYIADNYADEAEELEKLKALAEQGEAYAPDWMHGETLISDDYFTEYTEEFCKDCGDVPRDIPRYIEIDWEATAENIKQDYTSIDFDGTTYWIR